MASLESQNAMKQEKFALTTKLENQQAHWFYKTEKLNSMRMQIVSQEQKIFSLSSDISKQEAEKKEFAAQRKFKEASACQAQLKFLQTELEHAHQVIDKLRIDTQALRQASEEKQQEFEQI